MTRAEVAVTCDDDYAMLCYLELENDVPQSREQHSPLSGSGSGSGSKGLNGYRAQDGRACGVLPSRWDRDNAMLPAGSFMALV